MENTKELKSNSNQANSQIIGVNRGTINITNQSDTKLLERMILAQEKQDEFAKDVMQMFDGIVEFAKNQFAKSNS